MNCALNINQQRALFRKVYGDLNELKTSGQPFSLNDYIRSTYNLINEASKDNAMALDYSRLVPHYVMRSMIKDEDLMDYLLESGLNMKSLNAIKKSFTDNIDNVSKLLGMNQNTAQDLKVLQNQVINNGSKLEPNPLRPIGARPSITQEFRAVPPTAFADRGQEALSWDESNSNYNIPNPDTAFYYSVKRKILDMIMEPGVDFDSSNINFPRVGKLYLTIQSSTRIPEDQLYPGVAVNSDAHKKGVVMVLTDEYGLPIKFNNNLEVDFSGGKMAYYMLRKTEGIVNGNIVNLTKEDENSARALSRQTLISYDEALNSIKQQLKFIHDLRNYINLDPEKNEIKSTINGGSLGFAYNDYVKIKNPLSSVNFEGDTFDPFQAREDDLQKGLMKGFTYFYTKGMLDTPVEIKLSEISPDMKQTLISLFGDDLYERDLLGNEYPISPSDRQSLIDNYIKTGPDTIQLIPNSDNKSHSVFIKGIKLDESKPYNNSIKEYFNELAPSKFVDSKRIPSNAKIIEATDPKALEQYESGAYLKKEGRFYLIEGRKLHINNKSLNKNFDDVTFEKADNKIYIVRNSKSYNDFIKNNFHIDYALNGQNKLVKLNAYFTFNPLPEEVAKIYPQIKEIEKAQTKVPVNTIVETKTPADTTSIDDLLRETFDDPDLNKIMDQKNIDLKATREQVAAAKDWYEKHPLNKHFPFEAMFNAVNTKNPTAIASWALHGITLYKGADYSDLYHEAWHGFSQTFLNKDQRKSLYGETKKLSGSFIDYKGNRVSFSKATDLQLEEYLAEDFRSYMLSGGKPKTGSPVRNTLFRKILNFLKQLFSSSTVIEVADNEKALSVLHDIYEKIRVGNLNDYTFDIENRSFTTLNKGMEATTKDEPQKNLNYQNSKMMVDTMDSLISEFIDRANAGLNDHEKLRASELDSKKTLTPDEKEELSGLKSRQSYKYTSTLLKTDNGLKRAYKYAHIRIATIRNELARNIEKAVGPDKERLQADLDLLDYTLRNFGNTENLKANINGKGMIAYHQLKSKYISSEDREAFFEGELETEDELYLKGKEGYDRGGNESSLKDFASKEVLYLMRSLHKTDQLGKPIFNRFGVPELVEFDQVWNRLARMLQNTLSAEKMYKKILNESATYPPAKQLLNKLGPVRTNSSSEFNLWTSFWQTFNKTRIPLIQMTLEKSTIGEEGLKLDKPTYSIRIGEASADYKKVGQKWENYFKTAYDNPYIKTDKNGNNFLDTQKVLDAFPQNSLNGREFEFFNALGIRLSDKDEIHEALKKKNLGNARAIRNALYLIHQRGNIVIDSVGAIVREYPAEAGPNKTFEKIPGEKRNYNQLQEIEARYSDDHSNFMVTNAEGNTQFEHSLNNSLTVIVNTINDVSSYDELMTIPYMSYLDINRNPFAKASVWLNSIFDMNKPGRPKRKQSDDPKSPYVNINLQNLSGVAMLEDGNSTEEGVASAKADEFTKMILDFHLAVVNGTPELMRHADKGTSFSIWLSNINTKAESKRFYIDTTSFVEVNNRIPGYSEAYNIITPYIGAELSRIKEMIRLSDQGTTNQDFKYINRGKDFVIFDDVLSPETKKSLLSIKGNLTEFLNTNTPDAKTLASEIYKDLSKYFDKQVENTDKQISQAKFVADTVITQVRSEANKKKIQGVNDTMAYKAAVRSFVFNSWIHNLESIAMLYGDLAQYNMIKEEFHKRNAGMASTGDIFRTDQSAKDYINKVLGQKYAESLGLPIKAFDGTFSTSVMGDNEIGSKYYEEYLKALGDPKATKAYADKQMTEGDAQGWITFDSYRTLLNLEGKWSRTQEKLYQSLIKGETVDSEDIVNFFPTKKVQYFGPLDAQGLPVTAFHKFSLFPLIPSVIKGTNLDNLHKKMMNEGIDYSLFQSGSKVGTITKSGKPDEFYSNNSKRELSTTPFTKNNIFLEFLKDQLEIAPEYKGKVIFSTQLRKLIEDGLIEGGVPTDYNEGTSLDSRRDSWSKLSEKQRLDTSKRYRLLRAYEHNVSTLTNVRKKELLHEAGWKLGADGKPTGSIESLLEFVSKELARQDLADHELDFIQVGPDGKLKHDLSISLSAEKIEKLLNAMVTKRLIRQKVNGEGLIQVSGAGFENLNAYPDTRNYDNPSEEDLAKWGTNDLPTYHKGKGGKTVAMKVKIAMQGHFEKLLQLPSIREYARDKNISTIAALNTLIKDEDWLNQGENRRMVTMVGVRIPVQGLNSMEFMEVHEFLPKEAGNIIVPPAEIVAKSGSDFDIDKLTVMMPTFRYTDNNLEVAKQYSLDHTKELYEKVKKAKLEKGLLRDSEGNIVKSDTIKVKRTSYGEIYSDEVDLHPYNRLIESIFGIDPSKLDDELINEILAEEKMPSFEDFSDKLNGSKAVENDLIWNLKQILELPENFSNLIRPNGTDLVEPLARQLQDDVMEFNPKERIFSGNDKHVSGTRVLEIPYNLYKHTSNNIGKQTLGLGAVDNTYNVIFNRVGARMNPTYIIGSGNKAYERRLTLMLPHNTLDVNGKPAISLSHIYDAGENPNKISDVISQLMNGWVDIAKDAWIFNIQGNKEIAPSLLFMVQAGVPFKDAVYLVSQPLVREYIRQQKLAKSTFADPLGKAASNPLFFRNKAREIMLTSPQFGFGFTSDSIKGKKADKNIYDRTVELTDKYAKAAFTEEALRKNISEFARSKRAGTSYKVTDEERATFLHFLEIENMAKAIRDVKMRMNFDTSRSSTLFDAQNRQLMIDQLKADGRMPDSIVNDILENSPIGSFFIQPFQLEIWKDLFKLRNHPVLNDYLMSRFKHGNGEDVNRTFGDSEKFASEFRNDFLSFIFQNAVRDFDITEVNSYKGFNIDKKIDVKSIASLNFGAVVKDGTIYVDKDRLAKDFQDKTFSKEVYSKRGLATISAAAFPYARDYYKFVFEREYLRSLYPIDKITQSEDFQDNYEHNLSNRKNMLEGETDQIFAKRMKGVTYEELLRDMALDNTFNNWKIFKSKNTYADEFLRIKEKYPELTEQYNIIKSLAVSFNKTGLKNLKLNDTMLDSDKINVFNENLNDLSNPTLRKIDNPIENERVSQFFGRFATYAFLQSGLNTKSIFSLVRLVPQDKFLRMMEEPVKQYINKLNPVTMERFYDRFVTLNDASNRAGRVRSKDYAIDGVDLDRDMKSTLKIDRDDIEEQSETVVPLSLDYVGNTIYNSDIFKVFKPNEILEKYKDTIFVYNEALEGSIGAKNDSVLHQVSQNQGNALGLVTRKNYGGVGFFEDITNSEGDRSIDPKIKDRIDQSIASLIELRNQGVKIAFNQSGYGQYMIGADEATGLNVDLSRAKAPKTFLYLSEQLFTNFGYKNPNYADTGTGRKVMQSTQEVTDDMVKDMLNHCFNL